MPPEVKAPLETCEPQDVFKSPLLCHVPYSATDVPARWRDEIVLTESELHHELIAMTDHLTDALFVPPALEAGGAAFVLAARAEHADSGNTGAGGPRAGQALRASSDRGRAAWASGAVARPVGHRSRDPSMIQVSPRAAGFIASRSSSTILRCGIGRRPQPRICLRSL